MGGEGEEEDADKEWKSENTRNFGTQIARIGAVPSKPGSFQHDQRSTAGPFIKVSSDRTSVDS